MGVSTDGVIYFGFDFSGEIDNPQDIEFDDWEKTYAEKMGWKDDSGLFNKEGEYAIPEGSERDKADKLYDKRWKEKQAILEKCPVEIDMHCSYECPIHYVALKKSQKTANRGYPQEINPDKDFEITLVDIENMKSFCELMGIEWREPKWYLVSMWG